MVCVIKIRTGEITTVVADAIVNAANGTLTPGGGIDGDLRKAAGPELTRMTKLGLETYHRVNMRSTVAPGDCVSTSAADMQNVKYILHSVVPVVERKRNGQPTRAQRHALRRCYKNIVRRAEALKCSSIAIPVISDEEFGCNTKIAMLTALQSILDVLPGEIAEVIFVSNNELDITMFKEIMGDEELVVHSREEADELRKRLCDSQIAPPTSRGVMAIVRWLQSRRRKTRGEPCTNVTLTPLAPDDEQTPKEKQKTIRLHSKCSACGGRDSHMPYFPANSKIELQKFWIRFLGLDDQTTENELLRHRQMLERGERPRWCEQHVPKPTNVVCTPVLRDIIPGNELECDEPTKKKARTHTPSEVSAATQYEASSMADSASTSETKTFDLKCIYYPPSADWPEGHAKLQYTARNGGINEMTFPREVLHPFIRTIFKIEGMDPPPCAPSQSTSATSSPTKSILSASPEVDYEEMEAQEIPPEQPRSPLMDKFFLVSGEALLSLFRFCPKCGDRLEADMVTLRTRGCAPIVDVECACKKFQKFVWEGQQRAGDGDIAFLGNIILPAALHATGLHFTALHEALKTANVHFFTEPIYHYYLARYVLPATDSLYEEIEKKVTTVVMENSKDGVHLGADAQYDSPGSNASNARVDFVDLETGLVLHVETLERQETQGISGRMEVEGLRRGLNYIKNVLGIKIISLTTDRAKAVGTFMSTEFDKITHYIDSWHVIKGVGATLRDTARKRVGWRDLGKIRQRLVNHLYFAREKGGANGEMVKQIALSFLMHIINRHTWKRNEALVLHDEKFSLYKRCEHSKLGRRKVADFYLKPNSEAYKKLVQIFYEKNFYNALHRMSPFKHTSSNECYHSVCLKYASKRIHCEQRLFAARTRVATIHWNTLTMAKMAGDRKVVRKQTVQKKGREHPSQQKVWRGGEDHPWRKRVLDLTLREREKDIMSRADPQEEEEKEIDQEEAEGEIAGRDDTSEIVLFSEFISPRWDPLGNRKLDEGVDEEAVVRDMEGEEGEEEKEEEEEEEKEEPPLGIEEEIRETEEEAKLKNKALSWMKYIKHVDANLEDSFEEE